LIKIQTQQNLIFTCHVGLHCSHTCSQRQLDNNIKETMKTMT